MKNLSNFIFEKILINKNTQIVDNSYSIYGDGSMIILTKSFLKKYVNDTFNINIKDLEIAAIYKQLELNNIKTNSSFYHIQNNDLNDTLIDKIHNCKSIKYLYLDKGVLAIFYNIDKSLYVIGFLTDNIKEYFLYNYNESN